uniref:Uncharacterized protein n=1 Tax=Arundo donax TaxID=35708 RepID=A0A0A9BNH7_ARUDO
MPLLGTAPNNNHSVKHLTLLENFHSLAYQFFHDVWLQRSCCLLCHHAAVLLLFPTYVDFLPIGHQEQQETASR